MSSLFLLQMYIERWWMIQKYKMRKVLFICRKKKIKSPSARQPIHTYNEEIMLYIVNILLLYTRG